TSLASVFKDPGNEEKDGLVNLDTTVMVPLPSRCHLMVSFNFTARKLLHVVDVARTSTELELALSATNAALTNIAQFLCALS
ncbi:hypothetical protein Tco_0756065, partial [Tanacetum coccineum]